MNDPGHVVEFHPEAAAEAQAAFAWYRERSAAVAAAFLDELDRAVERVSERPDRWPATGPGLRRFHLRRFPFAIVYRIIEERVQVVAVVHGRRRPGYWRAR